MMERNIDLQGGYILLVEDEPTVQANNKKILERRGYRARLAFTLAEARAVMAEELPKAIVLDVHLPDGLGFDFLQELRKTSNIPVLLLTARNTTPDIIRGLEAGGDDYLPKPYDLPVFLMRLQALLRRASLVPDTLGFGAITINTAASKAYIDGEDMGVSQKELSLLQLFLQHPEEILCAGSLYEKVWGHKMLEGDNSLKVAISKLRSKLNNSGYTIVASRGEGYCLERE
jgi:DNA-binding response OmpR family regulator